MKIRVITLCGKMAAAIFMASIALFSAQTHATTLSFVEIVKDGGPNLSGQLSADVIQTATGAKFVFRNDVGIDSSVAGVFFDIGTSNIEDIYFSAADSSLTGVDFKPIMNPTLPEGNTLNPAFDANFGERKDGSAANGIDNGGEFAGFLVALGSGFSFQNLISDIWDGTFRVGLHVISIASEPDGTGSYDGSDAYVNAVPVPAAAWLFGSALFGFVVTHRRKKSPSALAQSKQLKIMKRPTEYSAK